MNDEDLLFSNAFVKQVETDDIAFNQKEKFRQHRERQLGDRSSELLASRMSMESTNGSGSASFQDQRFFSESSRQQPGSKPQTKKIERKTIVNVDSRDRDVNRFPFQHDFEAFLGKTFFNVKSIRLVSTEFPNTDKVIKDFPLEIKNNIITWQNEEDKDMNFFIGVTINTVEPDTVDITVSGHGFEINSTLDILIYNSKLDTDPELTFIIDGYTRALIVSDSTLRILREGGIPYQGTASVNLGYPQYSVTFTPGNYTASTLATEMEKQLNKIKRRNGTGQFHYFNVFVNLDTDVLTFDSVITKQLPNNPLSTLAGSTTITVHSFGHEFKTGDRVKMINVKNTSGIPGSVLNGDFIVTVLDFNTFTYEVNTKAIDTVDGGGNTVMTGKDAPFRILFDTSNTIIQYNIGFPNEDSSEAIGSSDSITTKTLQIVNATLIGDEIQFTTNTPHELVAANIVGISFISDTNPLKITTTSPHGLSLPTNITIRKTNSFPSMDGDFTVIPTGPSSFIIPGIDLISSGNRGQIIYGGDQIKILNFRSVPAIINEKAFFIERTGGNPYTLSILFPCEYIDSNSIDTSLISTEQIYVNHPNHGFNVFASITASGTDSAFIRTFLPHQYTGRRRYLVPVEDGPSGTSTVDLLIIMHGLQTSDNVTVSDSTCIPNIDGKYAVQVVDMDRLRINFVHGVFTNGTATVSYGDQITIIESPSKPKIDGTYTVDNQRRITTISTGTVTSVITFAVPSGGWGVGDIIEISESDSTPPIDGTHQIQSVIDDSTFVIDLEADVVNPGTMGIAVNRSGFKIYLGFEITSPGYGGGLVSRKNEILLYRIEGENLGGDNIGGVPLNVINGIQYPISRLIDTNNYMIRVRGGFARNIRTAGGNNIKISSLDKGLRSIQANTDTGDIFGALFRSISLEGVNYVYLTSPNIDCVLNSAGINNVFAKILLDESPGIVMFNSFVSTPQIFDYPIAKIDTMKLTILTPDGYFYNFSGTNYSISIELVELVDQPGDSYISSRTGGTEFQYSTGSGEGTGGGGNREFRGRGINGNEMSTFNDVSATMDKGAGQTGGRVY